MNKLIETLSILAAIALFSTACGARAVQAQSEEPIAPTVALYDAVLGRSLTDKEMADFITINNCSSADQLLLCKALGMALGINSNQVVETVFIYLNHVDGFTAYSGDLPFGLKLNDTRETVEGKLKEQRVGTGVANEAGAFDHTHCWARYYSADMTVIYNSPSAQDKGATIHAILLKE
jgi:hypothetical protein